MRPATWTQQYAPHPQFVASLLPRTPFHGSVVPHPPPQMQPSQGQMQPQSHLSYPPGVPLTFQQTQEGAMENPDRRLHEFDHNSLMATGGANARGMQSIPFTMSTRIQQTVNNQVPQQGLMNMVPPEQPEQRITRVAALPGMAQFLQAPPGVNATSPPALRLPGEVGRPNMGTAPRMPIPGNMQQAYGSNTIIRETPTYMVQVGRSSASDYMGGPAAVAMSQNIQQFYAGSAAAPNVPQQIAVGQTTVAPMQSSAVFNQQQPNITQTGYQTQPPMPGMANPGYVVQRHNSVENNIGQTSVQNYVPTVDQMQPEDAYYVS